MISLGMMWNQSEPFDTTYFDLFFLSFQFLYSVISVPVISMHALHPSSHQQCTLKDMFRVPKPLPSM
jgi:hypothetical protein